MAETLVVDKTMKYRKARNTNKFVDRKTQGLIVASVPRKQFSTDQVKDLFGQTWKKNFETFMFRHRITTAVK